jgi:cardiolipin synthase
MRPLRWRPARADLRNHRKLIVIDSGSGYIGSQNIVAADFRPGIHNEELVARVEGPIVAELQSIFLADWYLETGDHLPDGAHYPPMPARGDASLQLLPSGPDYPVSGSERLTVALVYAARSRVVLTTPYFIPDEGLLEALQSAVLRGTDVHWWSPTCRINGSWVSRNALSMPSCCAAGSGYFSTGTVCSTPSM